MGISMGFSDFLQGGERIVDDQYHSKIKNKKSMKKKNLG